jgi:hypothetical protein
MSTACTRGGPRLAIEAEQLHERELVAHARDLRIGQHEARVRDACPAVLSAAVHGLELERPRRHFDLVGEVVGRRPDRQAQGLVGEEVAEGRNSAHARAQRARDRVAPRVARLRREIDLAEGVHVLV